MLIKLFLRLIFIQLESTPVRDYFDIYCYYFIELLAEKIHILVSPEPKDFYHSDIGTLLPFSNHANIQTRDSLVDIYSEKRYYCQFDHKPY